MKTLAIILAATAFVYHQDQMLTKDQQIQDAQGEAAYEREVAKKLLSRGRWVRTIDERTQISTYRFATTKEQR